MKLKRFIEKLLAPVEKPVLVDKEAWEEAAQASLRKTKQEIQLYLKEVGYKTHTLHITSRSSGPSAWRSARPPRLPEPYRFFCRSQTVPR